MSLTSSSPSTETKVSDDKCDSRVTDATHSPSDSKKSGESSLALTVGKQPFFKRLDANALQSMNSTTVGPRRLQNVIQSSLLPSAVVKDKDRKFISLKTMQKRKQAWQKHCHLHKLQTHPDLVREHQEEQRAQTQAKAQAHSRKKVTHRRHHRKISPGEAMRQAILSVQFGFLGVSSKKKNTKKKNTKKHKKRVNRKKDVPASFSLQSTCPPIYDQGNIGSCTANAACFCYRFVSKDKSFAPSRLYLYAKERMMEGESRLTDDGADVADGLTWMHQTGVCSEQQYPYDTRKVNDIPPPECDQAASSHRVTSVYNADASSDSALHRDIQSALRHHWPVMVAIQVYQSFFDAGTTGHVRMPHPHTPFDPNDTSDPYQGGHEVAIVGYDTHAKTYLCANSWGRNWGKGGYFTLPFKYIEDGNLSQEFRAITNTTS